MVNLRKFVYLVSLLWIVVIPSVFATNTTLTGHTNLSDITIANAQLDSITVPSPDTLYINTTGTALKCRTIVCNPEGSNNLQ